MIYEVNPDVRKGDVIVMTCDPRYTSPIFLVEGNLCYYNRLFRIERLDSLNPDCCYVFRPKF